MKVHLKVDGMHCGGCVRAVQNVLSRMDGVKSVDVRLEAGEATVTAEPGIDAGRLVAAVEGAGYAARIASSHA